MTYQELIEVASHTIRCPFWRDVVTHDNAYEDSVRLRDHMYVGPGCAEKYHKILVSVES